MKTLHTIYTNFAKRNLARFLTVFTILFTIGIGQILGATARYTWDLTSSSANWTSSNCETYFSQPYGMKKKDAYIINKNIDDFKQYAATATSIQIGVKSLCNGATTSKLTIYLVDKDGNTVGSGMEITPDDKSSASNTTYKYVTFTSNLSIATGYKIQCTTFGKNVLVNGSSYEITYDDSSSGSGNTGGGNDSDGCTWELVTDASTLAAGDRIVIAAAGYDYAMGDNSSNGEYRIRTAITKNENKIAITNDVQIIILEEGTKTNTFAFNVDDSYLYASSSSSNQLKTKSTLDNNGSWSITIANGGIATIKAQGDKTRNWIRYNANSTQERFSCYGSGQSDVVIYKEICAKEVTITLNPDGGTGTFADWITSGDNYTMTVDAGTEITLPELSKTGYNFDGWHDGKATVTSLYTPTKDITLTAQWTAQQYNIIYKDQGNADYSGENIAYLPKSHTYDQTTTLVAGVKTGYTFDGWYKEPACTNKVTTLGATDYTSDITLYAQWTPNTYTVQFDANEGTGEMDNQSFTYDAEPTSLSANIFERVGYNFNGWNTADDGSGTSYADKEEVKNLTAEPNSVVTLYAQWTAKKLINYRTLCTYNIEYTNLEGATHTNHATYTAAILPLEFTAPSTREGYTFKGWDPATLSAETRGDQVVEAQWTANKFKVIFDANGGDGTMADQQFTYDVEQPLTKNTYTKTGYTFTGWNDNKNGTGPSYADQEVVKNLSTAANGRRTLYAQWTANTNTPYAVKHYKQLLDGTYSAEADETENLTGTTDASVTPTTKTYDGFTSPSQQTVTVKADGTLVVKYYYTRNSYILTWDYAGGSVATEGTAAGSVKFGAAITAPTLTKTGYNFAGWSPEVPATMPAANSTYTAQWNLITYTVKWMLGDVQYVDPTTVSVETPLTLPTAPANDALGCCANAFVGWSIYAQPTKEQVFNDLASAPVIDGNKTFHAVFATSTLTSGSATATFNEMGYANAEKVNEIALGDGEGHGDATLVFEKEQSASNYPTYYSASSALHAYAKNTITINSTSATSTITNVQFTFATKNDGTNTISVNVGTYADGIWTGSAESVVFTIDGETGHRKITSITVRTESVEKYTNYITQCTQSANRTLGEGTITYNNSGSAIEVKCGKVSAMNTAATLTFPNSAELTCPVTLTASDGFLISTSKSNDAGYQPSLTISPYKQGSSNAGKLRTIYIRANAEGKTENFNGTITLTGAEITNQYIIAVSANVNCQGYTFKLTDHLGNIIGTPTSYYEGDIIEEAPAAPEADACSEKYTFAGWSESAVEYGALVYNQVTFPYTMPNYDVTLYPVYRVNTTEDYHRVTYDLENNWAGDYLIAYSDNIFANGQACGTNGIGKASNYIDLSKDISNNTINYLQGDKYKVTLEKYNEGYLLKTQDGEYNYYTNINNDNMISTSATASTAGSYALDIKFESAEDIKLCLSGAASGSVFGYRGGFFRYFILNTRLPIYLYKKSPLYTTSLICGTIEAADAVVTSTAGQTIKVNVPITLKSTLGGTTTITAESDNEHFTVTPLENVTAGDHTIAVHYKPADDATTDDTEIANITLTASHGNRATTTFQLTGRHLPTKFVIATKVGANWYALPANMSEATNPEGVLIEVDEATMTATAPNTTSYTLFPVKTTNGTGDRYAKYGDRVRFSAVNYEYKGLWANNNATEQTVRNFAVIDAKGDDGEAAYEWKITTTVVDGNWQYTLQTYQDKNKNFLRYWTAASGGAKWGTYAAGNNQLYFLPVTETEPFDYKVVEWYPTKMLIQTDAAIANPTAKIGGEHINNITCINKGGKLYEISGLSLAENPTKVLTLSYTADEVTYTNSKVVPIILSRETKSISGEPFVALTKEVYNYADLVVRDGATLTMDGTQEANTLWDVTIYPTSQISVPESKKLTVHSLTLFGGIDEIYNGSTYTLNKYGVPELSLKGSLKKSISTIDYLMRVNLDQMYSLSVPYDVQLADIKYWDGSDIALGTALYVSAYDGEARANQSKKTWIYETDFNPATLKAGVGYTISAELQAGVGNEYSILRMPMMNNVANDATEGEKKVSVTAHGIDANITDNHKGWNLVGNPYMTTITGADDDDLVLGYLQETGTGPWEWVETTQRYVTIPMDNGKDYYQKKFTDAVLPPFKNFFVQIGTSGDLVFGLSTRQSMPARSTQAAIEKEVEFEILMSNDARQDNSGLLISKEYSPAYEINADLEKMIGSMSVYTIYGGYKLAYNALSPINASEWIPMGYIAPAAGEYTLSLDDVENIAEQVEHVYIIDYNANNIVDLMDEEYKFTTDKEQNDNRFAINVVLIQDKDNTTTGLDMIQGNNAAPIKFIHQDKMYIYNEGIIYDATGKQVTNINK